MRSAPCDIFILWLWPIWSFVREREPQPCDQAFQILVVVVAAQRFQIGQRLGGCYQQVGGQVLGSNRDLVATDCDLIPALVDRDNVAAQAGVLTGYDLDWLSDLVGHSSGSLLATTNLLTFIVYYMTL